MDEPGTPITDAPAPVQAPRRPLRHAWRTLAVALLAGLVLLVALVFAAWWSARTERGSAWLLSVLPGVQVEAPQGVLLGDFQAQRLVVRLPGGGATVTLAGVGWRGLAITRAPAPLWLRVAIDAVTVRRVDVATTTTPSGAPRSAPTTLRLPIELVLGSLHIDELHAAALGAQPVRDLDARVHLGAGAGAEHRIDHLTLGWDRLRLSGEARVATRAPLTLRAAIGLAQQGGKALPAWSAGASLAGPLASPVLLATLRAAPAPGRAAQSLDLRATLHPFAPWPLGELQASATALDLSAFGSSAPVTALTLAAQATSTAADRPAQVMLSVTNTLAGRWNEGRLPLRRLTLELAARPDRPRELTLRALDADLGTIQASAGRVTGAGRWSPDGWNLAATLHALQPSLLDARAPAMPLSGPLTLAGSAVAGNRIELKAELAGHLAELAPAREVRLTLDAGLGADRFELRALQARAGGARASLAGVAVRASSVAAWVVKAQGTLIDFDPALWWPGRSDAAWRAAPNRLNARGSVDLSVSALAADRPLTERLAALRGAATITLDKSLLAGVPLAGEATLRSGSGSGAQARLALRLDADGNTLRATGQLGTTGSGAGDAWDLSADGTALQRLAPLYRLFQPAGTDATLAGTLHASAHVSGRWPALASSGRLEAQALRVGPLRVAQAQAHWRLGSSAGAPLDAQATLSQASLFRGAAPGPSLESLQLQLSGTGRAHTLSLQAESKARPPAWAETLQSGAAPPAPAGGARTLAVLQAQGGFIDRGGAALAGWHGTVQRLELRSNAAGAAPLLQTADVTLEALWAGGPLRATVQPGRAEVLGAALRWSRIAWQAASSPGGYAQLDADAELEPLRIAPLLARAQPDFGWGGDLTVAGHLKLHTTAAPAPGFSADIVVERRAGDLTVTDELGTTALGLTDLRLGLSADHGVWNFTQGLAGTTLGVAAGAVVVHTAPQATWPGADAPIQGVLELRVADLGTWGPWVPPGWRLGGALHTSASIGGRFGAPEYTGEIDGQRLSVRNFLQGVNVNDGDLAIRLQGDTARIERFTAKGGSGSLKLEGSASLGATPKAELSVSADKFQLLGRVDRRIVASGSGQLQLDRKTLAFDGRFNVDEGLIDYTRSDAPTLSSDVEVVRARGAISPAAAASAAASATASAAASPAIAATPVRTVALNLTVGLGERLRLRGRGLDTGLRGELHISSPGGRLAVDGTVRTADGTYAAYGQKLSIDRGLITFNGPVGDPRLDIEATRPNLDVRVGVAISGYAANPHVRLFSDPALSEIDMLSWLVMGRASDALGSTDTALLQRAALALLAGEGGAMSNPLTQALGLADVSVRQSTGAVRQTVVALGKQLSQRWYVGYERGLNATAGGFQIVYRIAQRFTLRAQSGVDNSLDAVWAWRWN
ncbi:MAG: translocation/assembly module TamB domain-containing protein [Burkholderiales bacterium]|nr:translocation/assembly module TamB domain-containing protein [Burkholderiales bacterium]